MGVPALFRWLKEKMPKCIEDCVEDMPATVNGVEVPVHISSPNPNGIEFDNLYIDMNGVIHPCVHPEDVPAPETEEEMFAAIIAYVDRLVAAVRPRRLLYLAIDGVAPRAKMNQQRSRRFKAAQDMQEEEEVEAQLRAALVARGQKVPPKKAKASFDHNVITPGTRFMDKLSTHLRYHITQRVNSAPGWREIKVILSDAAVPGEGEHKIMDFLRQQRAAPGYNPNTVHCIHGLDADLIMLALATHEQRFSILREDVFGKQGNASQKCFVCGREGHRAEQCTGTLAPPPSWDEEAKDAAAKKAKAGPGSSMDANPHSHAALIQRKPMQFLHIPILREYLDLEFKGALFPLLPPLPGFTGGAAGAVNGYSLERLIDDFVFICFFVGNDFLPHLPSLDIREGAIDLLLALYKQVLPTLDGYLTENGTINLARVDVLLQRLGACETEIFRRRRVKEEREAQRDESKKRDQAQRDARQQSAQNNKNARDAGAAVALKPFGGSSEDSAESPSVGTHSSSSSSSLSAQFAAAAAAGGSRATQTYRAKTAAAELALKEGMALMLTVDKENKKKTAAALLAGGAAARVAAATAPSSENLRSASEGSVGAKRKELNRAEGEDEAREELSPSSLAAAAAAVEPPAKRSRPSEEAEKEAVNAANKSAAAALKNSLLGNGASAGAGKKEKDEVAGATNSSGSDGAEIPLDAEGEDNGAADEDKEEGGLFMPSFNPSSKEGVTGDAAKSHSLLTRAAAAPTAAANEMEKDGDDDDDGSASTVAGSAAVTVATAASGAATTGGALTTADMVAEELEAEELDEGMIDKEVTSAISGILKVSVLKALMEKRTHEHVTDNIKLGVGQASEWRERYYKSKFGESEGSDPVFMSQVYKSYIEGLVWVFRYYYQGVVSWTWFYPYHYAPFAGDLRNLGAMASSITFDLGKPFRPLDQLMGVLPPRSAHALPAACKALMCEESSPVKDFYPEKFDMDPNGKKFTWQWVVVLPFIDEKRLIAAIDSVGHTFTEEEKRRNLLGSDLLFVNQNLSGLSKFLLPLFKLDLPPQVVVPGAAPGAPTPSVPVVSLKPHMGDAASKGLSASCFRIMDAPAGFNRKITVPNPTKGGGGEGAGSTSTDADTLALTTYKSPFPLTFQDIHAVQVLIVAVMMPSPRRQHVCSLLAGADPTGGVLDPHEDDPSGRIPRLTRGMNVCDLAYAMTAETYQYSQGASMQRAMATTSAMGQAMLVPQMMPPQMQMQMQMMHQQQHHYPPQHQSQGFYGGGPGAAGAPPRPFYPQQQAAPHPHQHHHQQQQQQHMFFNGNGNTMGATAAAVHGQGYAQVQVSGQAGAPGGGGGGMLPMPMPMQMPMQMGGMGIGMGMAPLPPRPPASFGAAGVGAPAAAPMGMGMGMGMGMMMPQYQQPQQQQQQGGAPRPFSFRR